MSRIASVNAIPTSRSFKQGAICLRQRRAKSQRLIFVTLLALDGE